MKVISLWDGFGEVAVSGNGIRVELHADGNVDAYTSGAVKVHAAANDESKSASLAGFTRLEPGVRMRDGTIYAGISPDTGKPMNATPADVPLTMKWKQAMEYAAKLDHHGRH